VVEVSFAFAPEFNQTATVQPDGFISLRQVEPIFAEGATARELERLIAEAYVKLLQDPQISVVLKDFDHPYFIVGGEVTRPGKYELRGITTLSEAVAVAGGFTQQSKHSQVVLFRRVSASLVETHTINVKEMLKHRNLTEEPTLEPGDYVFVPRNMVSKIMRFMPSTSMGMYSSSSRF
jgi:polysaccharide export outer membrane protein